MRRGLALFAALALFGVLAVVRAQVSGETPADGASPPPAVAQTETPPAPGTPGRNQYRKLVTGLYVRTVYVAEEAPLPVEIWGVVLAPGQAEPARFPGAVVFEVISGDIVVDEPKLGEMRAGSSFAVEQGASVVLRNTGEAPATLRAVVVGGEGS